jgi:hypothetical protein
MPVSNLLSPSQPEQDTTDYKRIKVRGVGELIVPAAFTPEQSGEYIRYLRTTNPEYFTDDPKRFNIIPFQPRENKPFSQRAGEFVEDLGYPGVGAGIGGFVGSGGGPLGTAAGAGIGAMAGEATKNIVRKVQGRGEEDPNKVALDIATAGAYGPLQEIGPVMRVGKPVGQMLTQSQQLAQEFSVPMTKAQQTQAPLRSAYERVLRRAFGTQGVIRTRLETPQNEALIKAADDIAASISNAGGSPLQHGEFIQNAISAARKAASDLYDDTLKYITQQGGSDVPLNISGNLKRRAQELIKELELPKDYKGGLENVESRNMAIHILEQFAEDTKTVTSALVGPSGQPMRQVVPKRLSFEEARRLRTQLRSLTDKADLPIGEGALKQLNHELDVAMKEGLIRAGRKDLTDAFETASGNYRTVMSHIEQSTISRLVKSDKPELIADILLSKGAESTSYELRALIGTKNMQRVERALWEKLYQNVLTKNNDVMVGRELERAFNGLGEETQQAIWGTRPDLLGKIKRFVETAKTVALDKSLMAPTSAQGSSLLAFGQFAGVTAGVTRAASAVLQADPQGFVLNLGGAGAVVLTPAALARMMTSTSSIDVATAALKTKTGTKAGTDLATRIMSLLMAEEQKKHLNRDILKLMERDTQPRQPKVTGIGDISRR